MVLVGASEGGVKGARLIREQNREMNSEKSEQTLLGSYVSNGIGGQKLFNHDLPFIFPWPVLSLDFPNFEGYYSVSILKMEVAVFCLCLSRKAKSWCLLLSLYNYEMNFT